MSISYITQRRAPHTGAARCFFMGLCLLSLTSCTTTHIPGLDRILFPNSTAKVGPLLSSDEQYPAAKSPEETVVAGTDIDMAPAEAITSNVEPAPDQTPATQTPIATPQNVKRVETSPAPKSVKPIEAKKSVKPIVAKESLKPLPIPERRTAQKEKSVQAEPVMEKASLSGKVVLVGNDGKAISPLGTLVSLTPKEAQNTTQKRGVKRHIIDMEQKEYQPRYSSINAGDQVIFVNKDKIQHNVFSSSGGNAFDLGTYGAGLKRAVTLEQPGIVKIYCNIHANMATFVAVGNQDLSAQADEQGHYVINDLLPGAYELRIWNIRGEVTRTIELKANDELKVLDRIDIAASKRDSHKNKFGGNYPKNSSLFEDEFY